ncbi:MAG: hypothetical protein ACYC6C_02800 [Coriobacteriia bacterium]
MMQSAVRVLICGLLVLAIGGCAQGEQPFERDTDHPANELIESKCSTCHDTERVFAAEKTADEWNSTVDRMERNGLVITDAEQQQIVEYLSE